MIAALSSAAETAWWVSLGVGLVVALVVWALLEALRRQVDALDRSFDRAWVMGKRLAQNTATTHMLGATKEQGVELLEEVERHAALARGERPERSDA